MLLRFWKTLKNWLNRYEYYDLITAPGICGSSYLHFYLDTRTNKWYGEYFAGGAPGDTTWLLVDEPELIKVLNEHRN